MRFRVLHGVHADDKRSYKRGEIVDTNLDLCALFNQPGCEKFERIQDGITVAAPPVTQPAVSLPEKPATPDFESMTVAQLQDYADENEIDLGDAARKAEIIAVLRNT